MDKIIVPIVDQLRPLTQGANKRTYRMVGGFQLVDVRAALATAQAGGNPVEIDLKRAGISLLSGPLTVANGSQTTVGNASVVPLGGVALADEDQVQIDILQIGDGSANGLTVALLGYELLGAAVNTSPPPPPPPPPPTATTTWDTNRNGGFALSNGNLTATASNSGTNSWFSAFASMGKSSGKYYWEIILSGIGGSALRAAAGAANAIVPGNPGLGSFAQSVCWEDGTNVWDVDGVTNHYPSPAGGSPLANGQVLRFALDMDAGVIYGGLDNAWFNSGNPETGIGALASGLTGTWYPAISANGYQSSAAFTANFGAAPFAYSVPSGFQAGFY